MGRMTRTTVSHDTDGVIYEFHPDLEPAYTASDGESLTFETIDSLNGAVQSDNDVIDNVPKEVNAATGPVAVEGASPGDILKVDIEEVRLSEDRGRVVTIPGFGLLQDDDRVEAPSTRITPVDEDTIDFLGNEIDVQPVIGTIGVAPDEDDYTTLVPHDHGGNLDTTDITDGSTVYFPVFQEGGQLAMGDSKAAMADGEMCGTGSEISTDIDVTVEVIKNPDVDIQRPIVETSTHWKVLASAETLEEATELVHQDALDLISSAHGFDRTDAHLFGSLVGGLEISQVVDPLVTVRNAIPKEHLPDPF